MINGIKYQQKVHDNKITKCQLPYKFAVYFEIFSCTNELAATWFQSVNHCSAMPKHTVPFTPKIQRGEIAVRPFQSKFPFFLIFCSLIIQLCIVTKGSSLHGSRESLISYDPIFYRNLEHPTTSKVALIHLLKVIIDGNFLAMPLAFKNAGMYVGLLGSIAIGIICTHCVHVLLRCCHELCRRQRVPSMEYSEVAYNAFATGPLRLRRYSSWAKYELAWSLF